MTSGICFYHRRFKENAHRCMPNCPYYNTYTEYCSENAQRHSQTQKANVNTISKNALMNLDAYIQVQDSHNNITFIVDTASPCSIIPSNFFPSFKNVTNRPFQDLFAANGQPLVQSGKIELTLLFNSISNKQFIHEFLLANVQYPILGLDFQSKQNIIIDPGKKIIFSSTSTSINDVPPLCSQLVMKIVLIRNFLSLFLMSCQVKYCRKKATSF